MAVEITEGVRRQDIHGRIFKVTATITSDSGGDATGETTNPIEGMFMGVMVNPDGSAAPTDNWDLTVTNEDGVDLLGGNGADLSTSASQYRPALVANAVDSANVMEYVPVAGSKLTFTGANMGNAKKAVVTALVLMLT